MEAVGDECQAAANEVAVRGMGASTQFHRGVSLLGQVQGDHGTKRLGWMQEQAWTLARPVRVRIKGVGLNNFS